MKAATAKKPLIRIAVVESDPLRFVGFRALFDTESDFELISASLPDIGTQQNIDLVLLGNRSGQNLFDVMASLKAVRPDCGSLSRALGWIRNHPEGDCVGSQRLRRRSRSPDGIRPGNPHCGSKLPFGRRAVSLSSLSGA